MNRKKIVVALEIRMFLKQGSMGANDHYFLSFLSFREKPLIEQPKSYVWVSIPALLRINL